MSLPTKAEKYAELCEHLRKASEAAATLGHLVRDESEINSKGWLTVSVLLDRMLHRATQLATKVMH